MARIIVECSDPNSLDEIQAAMWEYAGKCNVTYYNNAKAMMDSGKATSTRDAARKIADDTGESEESVRNRIRRGKKEVGHSDPTEWPKCIKCNKEEISKKAITRGPRRGNFVPQNDGLCGNCRANLFREKHNKAKETFEAESIHDESEAFWCKFVKKNQLFIDKEEGISCGKVSPETMLSVLSIKRRIDACIEGLRENSEFHFST